MGTWVPEVRDYPSTLSTEIDKLKFKLDNRPASRRLTLVRTWCSTTCICIYKHLKDTLRTRSPLDYSCTVVWSLSTLNGILRSTRQGQSQAVISNLCIVLPPCLVVMWTGILLIWLQFIKWHLSNAVCRLWRTYICKSTDSKLEVLRITLLGDFLNLASPTVVSRQRISPCSIVPPSS